MNTLFVYGTMLSGYRNHDRLIGSFFIRKARTLHNNFLMQIKRDTYYAPVVYRKENGFYINGEIYHIDNDLLEYIDKAEGHPYIYKREIILTDDGKTAWIYIYQKDIEKNFSFGISYENNCQKFMVKE